MFVAHVSLNRENGLPAKVGDMAMTPSLVRKGLDKDYKDNLY